MRIIFMGTPDFAVPALKALMQEHEIVAVYCQPPKPVGRGKKLTKQPVHQVAEAHDIPVFTPVKLSKQEEIIKQFEAFNADVAVICAYGLLLPKPILDAPKYGCINIHASLLPRWRGASPIHAAIQAGDEFSGVCIMGMEQGLDTGPVYLRDQIKLAKDETSGSLHDKLSAMGARLMVEVLSKPLTEPVKQPEQGVTYAPKLSKSDSEIDWSLDAVVLERKIRANTPWPGSFTHLTGEKIHIGSVDIVDTDAQDAPPGTVLSADLDVACGRGVLRLNALQKPGKKMLSARDFQNGAKIAIGDRFE